MADSANITRRNLIAAAGGVAVLAATPAAPLAADPWESFIEQLAWVHPNGRQVALRARDGGLELADLHSVALGRPGASRDDFPVLFFGDVKGGRYSVVTPEGGFEYRRFGA